MTPVSAFWDFISLGTVKLVTSYLVRSLIVVNTSVCVIEYRCMGCVQGRVTSVNLYILVNKSQYLGNARDTGIITVEDL